MFKTVLRFYKHIRGMAMKKRYRIGEVAKIKNIDAQTLRYYDKLGILSPEIIDESNQYRYYNVEQFMDVDCIKFCKMIGFSLEEIKNFKEITDIDESLRILKLQKNKFKRDIIKKQAILKNVEGIIQSIEETKNLYKSKGNNIEIKECDDIYGVIGECNTANDWYEFEKKLCKLTEIYPNYSEIGHNKNILLICEYNFLNKIKQKDIGFMGKILLPIDKSYINDKNVEKYPIGKCIVTYSKGSHESIGDILKRIKEFIYEKKINIRGDIIIFNIINKFVVNNPDEFLMEIKVPIVEV
jgi:DNA-binding transcriptional MerR regulator/effector-binding domain-containing protein